MRQRVVIDGNRIFAALISSNHQLRHAFATQREIEFYCPKYFLVELFKHKERIDAAAKMDEAGLLSLLHRLLERIHFFDEAAVSIGSWTEAWRLCRDVEENDLAYVALTLELDGKLWTSDRKLETALRKKGFSRFFSGT